MSKLWAVGITGRAQHGKDTIAGIFEREGYTRFSFAAALKDLAYRINPILDVSLESVDLRLQEIVDRYGWEEAKKDTEVRRFLQELGTQARHVLGPNVWVDAVKDEMAKSIHYGHGVVVSDVRFPNEADAIRSLGGIVIRVVRPGFENGVDPTHPSESQVDDLGHEFTVLNDGTLGDLESRLRQGLMNYMVGRGVRG